MPRETAAVGETGKKMAWKNNPGQMDPWGPRIDSVKGILGEAKMGITMEKPNPRKLQKSRAG